MNDAQKFQRATSVFRARLLLGYGPAAPNLPRQIADELEWLEAERAAS